MADDKKRLSVTLKDPNNPKVERTFTLKQFTPEVFEQFQEREADNVDAGALALESYTKEENVPDDLRERLTYLRTVRKVAATERIAGTYRSLQFAIDTTKGPTDHMRDIEEPVLIPEPDFKSEQDSDEVPPMVINPVWVAMGNDLTECERALRAFRELLGVQK